MADKRAIGMAVTMAKNTIMNVFFMARERVSFPATGEGSSEKMALIPETATVPIRVDA